MASLSEYTIREYTPDDIEKMTVLWQSVFGDQEEFIRSFYIMLPQLGTAVVAENNGRIVGMAHTLSCMSLLQPAQAPVSCGYLYAVAVNPWFRSLGLGATLSRAAHRLALQQGAEIFCTSPAEPSLYQWYHSILQTAPCLYRTTARVSASASAAPESLTASEYNTLREQALASVPHMTLSDSGAALLYLLCCSYGGGLFRAGSSIAALSSEASHTVLYELLPLTPGSSVDASRFARSGAVDYYQPALSDTPGAKPYLASTGVALSPGTVWNLVFE